MLKRLRSWWKNTSKTLDVVVILMLVVLLAVIMVSILGYAYNLNWSGLHGKTFWDWLQLLIIPAVLAVGGYLFNYTTSRNDRQANEKRAETDHKIALNRQDEENLRTYIDSMSALLLDRNLRKSEEDSEVRTIAHVRTLTVLSRLDGERKGTVIKFLHEAGLINKDNPIISLELADLSEAELTFSKLSKADLSWTDLNGANLANADLTGAILLSILSEANLSNADLTGADLTRAVLTNADLTRAKLRGANLDRADLRGANLSEATLYKAKLHGDLTKAVLYKAYLREANLRACNLREANLSGADLMGAELRGADLYGADLSEANLTGAKVYDYQLRQAKSLKDTITQYGIKHV